MNVENTSGQGPASQVPGEIQHWNWGAFLLNWIWGIRHNTLAALLVFIPLFGFVCGVRGNDWAWRNRRWDSVEQFRAAQRRWALWGVVAWVAAMAVAWAGILGIASLFKDSDAFRLAQASVEADERVTQILGRPISTGFVTGSIRWSGPDGSASLSYSVEGPRGEGQVFVEARQRMGQWTIRELVFQDKASGRRIDLAPEASDEMPAGAT